MKNLIAFFLFCSLLSGFWPRKRIVTAILLALFVALLMPAPTAFAACSGPAGNAADTIYDGDAHVPEYCNGVSWVVMAPTINLPTTNGLIGYWKLNDGSGTSAADSSGNGDTGTLVNSPTWTTGGYYNGALTFNGTNQYVSLTPPSFIGTGAGTISAWIYPLSNPPGEQTYFKEATPGVFCAFSGFNSSYVCSNDGSAGAGSAAGSLVLNQWQFVTVIRYSDGTMTFYINGVQSGAANQNAGTMTTATSGNSEIGGGANYANAIIDDVRVYNRPLSAAEITTLYNYHISPPSSGLVARWKFDESSGTAADSSGNGNTATLVNGPVFTSAGKLAGALTFSAAGSQYVSVPSVPALKPATSFSVSAWVKPTSTSAMAIIKAPDATGFTTGWRLAVNASPQLSAIITTSNVTTASAYSANPPAGQWTHVAFVYDGSFLTAYTNGVAGTPAAVTGTVTYGSADTLDIGSSNGVNFFDGTIDDVRIYNRALSADEIYGIYRTSSPTCSSPSSYEGDVMYNGDSNHVLQFCDNASWRPLGPVPGAGGSGCTSPTGNEGDTIYSDSTKGSGVMQYCDGAKWVQIGGPNLPTSGLVGYWKFDDGSGTSAADSSGNGNTGALINSPTWTTGKDAGALNLVYASNQSVNVPDVSSLDLSGSWTVSDWVNPGALPAPGNYVTLAEKEAASFYTNYGIIIDNNSGTYTGGLGFAVEFDDTSGTNYHAKYVPEGGISLNTWYLVTGVWDSSTNNLYLYVNGSLVATQNESGHAPDGNSGHALYLASYLTGTLDEVRVYNRALSAQEIWQLYDGT